MGESLNKWGQQKHNENDKNIYAGVLHNSTMWWLWLNLEQLFDLKILTKNTKTKTLALKLYCHLHLGWKQYSISHNFLSLYIFKLDFSVLGLS